MISKASGLLTLDGVLIFPAMSEAELLAVSAAERGTSYDTTINYRVQSENWSAIAVFESARLTQVRFAWNPGQRATLQNWSEDSEAALNDEHERMLTLWLGAKSWVSRDRAFSWGTVAAERDLHTGDASIVITYD